eukprot:CAMPEP_0197186352 /NCGR_PEP_ID=MMETSP1423-20130617/13753_1 /TAXON_ID=476441 /ORGANISM="Pseudo-nitzschia heimii, Strain UNC1101" /LENGTH=417 /DNA_ID=CAMNT_0042637639 /DNA_START=84 /DNA_END=1337 /DNA_ORIENTATION=+
MHPVSLSADSIHTIIDSTLASLPSISLSGSSHHENLLLRRVKTPHDWNRVSYDLPRSHQSKRNEIEDHCGNVVFSPDVRTPFYFGIQAVCSDSSQHEEKLIGFCTFYIAYSTWDGRILYVDQFNMETDHKILLYRILAEIATQIHCERFTWKQKERPEWDITTGQPEYLHDWVFLSMDREAMANFVGSPLTALSLCQNPEEGNATKMKSLLFLYIEDAIRETLVQQKLPKQSANIRLRLAGSEDTETISRLVRLLAVYEKEPDAVNVTADDYFIDGYHSTEPLFYCILADIVAADEEMEEEDGCDNTRPRITVAMGLFYFGHNLNDGPFLYLEDLFCEEAYRGKGIGTAIMKQLANISLSLDCSQFIWTALDWNVPALSFYKKIGAKMNNEAKITRYCGSDIQSFARSGNQFTIQNR